MTRSIIRRVDWTCAAEPNSPHPIHAFACSTCGEQGPASTDFEEARGWTFTHVGRHPSHTGFLETVTRWWRMTGDGVDQPSARPTTADIDEAVRLSYVVEPPSCMACHDVGCPACLCPNCGGRAAAVSSSSGAETECWRCQGTGRIRPLASRPTLMYGAPFIPAHEPPQTAAETTTDEETPR